MIALRSALGALAAAATFITSCHPASATGESDCVPAPGSCDAPPPEMSPLDFAQGCLTAPVVMRDVCDTSVSRCTPSAGIGPVCAFAPDGGVFVAILSDNDMLTAEGWRFSQPLQSFPNPAAIPLDQIETPAEDDECVRAQCARPCPGIEPLSYPFICSGDGGDAAKDVPD
jgi:hypothetical protein